MIAAIIVVTSLLLTGAFAIAWVTKPELRRRIERPKHLFAAQVQQYDQDLKAANRPEESQSSESR